MTKNSITNPNGNNISYNCYKLAIQAWHRLWKLHKKILSYLFDKIKSFSKDPKKCILVFYFYSNQNCKVNKQSLNKLTHVVYTIQIIVFNQFHSIPFQLEKLKYSAPITKPTQIPVCFGCHTYFYSYSLDELHYMFLN